MQNDNENKDVQNNVPNAASPTQANTPAPVVQAKPKTRKFELELFDIIEDDHGNQQIKKVITEKPMIVDFESKKDFDSFMEDVKLSGQIAKVVREITVKPTEPVNQNQVCQSQQIQPTQQQPQQVINEKSTQTIITEPVAKPKAKPKIITIGDVQLKYDGDVVYQKQWIKLNSNEAANFRIVNDSNNKLFNLNGKHIEVKRWIRVDESPVDDDTCEYLLND